MRDILPYTCQETHWKELVETALHMHLLSMEEYNQLYRDFEALLYTLLHQYTRGHTSVLKIKQYKRILKSFYHTLDQAIPSLAPLSFIKETPLQKQYEIGKTSITQQLTEIDALWLAIRQYRLPFANERYQNLLDWQIPSFLANYDPIFGSHQYIEDFDYPLLDGIALDHSMYGMAGSAFVEEYLSRFLIESRFTYLYKEELPAFLEAYEQNKGVRIMWLGANLCELLLTQLIWTLNLPNPTSLLLDEQEAVYLEARFQKENIACLDVAFDKLAQKLKDPAIVTYVQSFRPILATRIQNALATDSLSSLMILRPSLNHTIYQSLPSCDPSLFVHVLDEVCSLSTLQEKLACIFQTPLSIQDRIDLLTHDVFMEEEYPAFFDQLPTIELAAFVYACIEPLLAFHTDITDELLEEAKEEPWQQALCTYIRSLPKERTDTIYDLLQRVEFQIHIG